MTQHAPIIGDPAPHPFYTFGLWAVITGGLGLIAVFTHMAGPWLEPSPSAASQIGEIAGEIRRSAWASLFGGPEPAPVEETVEWWIYLAVVGPTLGVMALVLSLISGVRRENWHYPAYGTALGASAILLQFVWIVAMMIMGVILLVAIIENIGDIFGGGFWG
ncbi:hypothetical protein P6F26_01210 [Roseibacterium sp. SDUM158017]|uniref:hypothetical protein n=1 Tax=Roseicyclus salinarum TaxID=3036773 RepID=UPI0024154E2A|nr:hypothetical protein [Roseibacterium sp. SDUM158017]MDG4647050.1 hypothetical protein [Roseibacterium sp. SDUM158017]